MVQRELAPFARDERETLRAQMTELEQTAADLGMKMEELPDTAPKKQEYLRLQKQLAEGTNLAGLETGGVRWSSGGQSRAIGWRPTRRSTPFSPKAARLRKTAPTM